MIGDSTRMLFVASSLRLFPSAISACSAVNSPRSGVGLWAFRFPLRLVAGRVGFGLTLDWCRRRLGQNPVLAGPPVAAAGAVEFAATALSVSTGRIPPTINHEQPGPDCPLDYVTQGAESNKLNLAMSQSFGFGGGNACLVIKRYENRRE